MIFVSGLSGQLSGLIARRLRARGVPFKGSSRHPEAVTGLGALEVVNAPHEDTAALTRALEGVECFFLVSTQVRDEGVRQAQHRSAIQAARAAGVRRVVYTSFQSVNPDSPFPAGATHAATERALEDSGLAFTFLRAGLYADFLTAALAAAVASGTLAVPAGDGAAAYVTREDLADVAAAVLAGGGFENEALLVTGPEALTQAALAELAAGITGRPVRYQPIGLDGFAESMSRRTGLPLPAARGFGSLYTAIAQGEFAEVGDGVPRAAGHEATGVRAFLQANREALLTPPGPRPA